MIRVVSVAVFVVAASTVAALSPQSDAPAESEGHDDLPTGRASTFAPVPPGSKEKKCAKHGDCGHYDTDSSSTCESHYAPTSQWGGDCDKAGMSCWPCTYGSAFDNHPCTPNEGQTGEIDSEGYCQY